MLKPQVKSQTLSSLHSIHHQTSNTMLGHLIFSMYIPVIIWASTGNEFYYHIWLTLKTQVKSQTQVRLIYNRLPLITTHPKLIRELNICIVYSFNNITLIKNGFYDNG